MRSRARNDCEAGGDGEVYCESDRDGSGDGDSDAYRDYRRFRHGGRGIFQGFASAPRPANKLYPVKGLIAVEGVKPCAQRWRPLADGQLSMSLFSCAGVVSARVSAFPA